MTLTHSEKALLLNLLDNPSSEALKFKPWESPQIGRLHDLESLRKKIEKVEAVCPQN